MNSVRIKGFGVFKIRKKIRILDLLIDKGIMINASCGGRGRCGLCRVKIKGKVRSPDNIESVLIPTRLLKQGYRLACWYTIDENIELAIPKTKKKKTDVSYGSGLVLDIGTTVIKGAMVDLDKGKVVKKASIYNPQNSVGGDVLTRIGFAIGGRYQELRKLLIAGINMVGEQLGLKKPIFTTVVGNSVMLSFFLNKPVDGLAQYPFKPAFKKGKLLRRPPRYIFPIIGGFVGADTIAGILASDLISKKGNFLYIDLGTNGEVALVKNGKVVAISTAAGPAFEGVGISCGSLAVPGAIDKVWYRKGLRFHTIEDKEKTVGFCASGLIDLLAVFLRHRWLKEDGRLLKEEAVGGFVIKQKDIRKLQLAIGAIHVGIEIMLEKNNVKPSSISETVVTGEFGSHLDRRSLTKVGLLPRGLQKITLAKDLPLKGGIEVLLDNSALKDAENIERHSEHLELAIETDFQEKFISALNFSPWP